MDGDFDVVIYRERHSGSLSESSRPVFPLLGTACSGSKADPNGPVTAELGDDVSAFGFRVRQGVLADDCLFRLCFQVVYFVGPVPYVPGPYVPTGRVNVHLAGRNRPYVKDQES